MKTFFEQGPFGRGTLGLPAKKHSSLGQTPQPYDIVEAKTFAELKQWYDYVSPKFELYECGQDPRLNQFYNYVKDFIQARIYVDQGSLPIKREDVGKLDQIVACVNPSGSQVNQPASTAGDYPSIPTWGYVLGGAAALGVIALLVSGKK